MIMRRNVRLPPRPGLPLSSDIKRVNLIEDRLLIRSSRPDTYFLMITERTTQIHRLVTSPHSYQCIAFCLVWCAYMNLHVKYISKSRFGIQCKFACSKCTMGNKACRERERERADPTRSGLLAYLGS